MTTGRNKTSAPAHYLPPFALKAILKEHGISPAELSAELGIHSGRLYGLFGARTTTRVYQTLQGPVEEALRRRGVPTEGIWNRPDGPAQLGAIRAALRARTPPPPPPEPPATFTEPSTTAEVTTIEEEKMLLSREYLNATDLKYWQLAADPFEDASPGECWMGDNQRDVEHAILRAVRLRDPLAIIGEVGSGKSTVLRRFLAGARNDKSLRLIVPATLDRGSLTEGAIATAICRGLAPSEPVPAPMEDRSEKAKELILQAAQMGMKPVLVIEEAHHLPVEALVALKVVWDSHELYRYVAIILVGQGNSSLLPGGLELKLNDLRVREFKQRTPVVRLEPLTEAQIRDYFAWRFSRVNAKAEDVFAPEVFSQLAAMPAIAYPLALGNLGAAAMRIARGVGDDRVTPKHVMRAGGRS